MLALLQRVTQAQVLVNNETVGAIDQGLLVFVGFEPADKQPQLDKMLRRLLGYRIFCDAKGKMNLSVTDIQGGLLLVPQFTLAADTTKGMRPGFSTAAAPDQAILLFDALCQAAKSQWQQVQTGRFGADMQISLINDGPVTFLLQT